MASRFWVGQPISAIADNGSGKCRCTVTSTTGMTTSDTRFFANMTGTVGLAGNQTITVIDATHVDVTAIAFVATGTGSIHGQWDGSNTNNWVTTTGGTNYGQTVPGSADTVTFDTSSSNSNTPTVTAGSAAISISTLTISTFAGTLDFATNAPTVTVAGANGVDASGAGVKTIAFGASTWNFQNAAGLNLNNANNTITAGAATLNFSYASGATSQSFSINAGNITAFASATFNINGTRTVGAPFAFGTGSSIGTLNVTSNCNFNAGPGNTLTIGTLNVSGTFANPIYFASLAQTASTATVNVSTSFSLNYALIRNLAFGGVATKTNTNCWDLGNNSGVTINNPSQSSGGGIIAG